MDTVRLLKTDANGLGTWERAEVERSSNEARKSAPRVKPTAPSILRRYANPSASTVFPLEYAFHLIGNVRDAHVLDLGCGSGQSSSILATAGARVSAIDISTELLTLAARRFALDRLDAPVAPLRASAHAIPLVDASMDLVFGIGILHHVNHDIAAREVHRVLKPGGRAIFKEPVRDSRTLSFIRSLIPYRHPDVSPFERPLRHDELRAFASRFNRWEHREFELPFVQLGTVLRLHEPVLARLRAWDRRLLDRSSSLQRLASIMVLQVWK